MSKLDEARCRSLLARARACEASPAHLHNFMKRTL